MNLSRPIYFGCWTQPGHGFHYASGAGVGPYDKVQEALGFGPIDASPARAYSRGRGGLYPSERQGEAAHHHANGWTALAWADRSVDSRGGSHSAVFMPGTLTFDEAVEQATRSFPHIMARQPVPLWDTAVGRG